jgi:signal transduction histidine kinase
MKQEVTFKSQARIIRTLGDRLISGEVAAIIELVKNAYDADATSCFVEFDSKNDILTIIDDGHGMSINDIQTKWAELGTDNKFRNKLSLSGKRRVLGNKGIGRLAASKLGRYLRIDSTTQGNNNFKSVIVDGVDWSKFLEEQNNYIEDIKFYAEEVNIGEKCGTTLTISNLSQGWSKEKLEDLYRELRKLMSPIAKDDTPFNIYLNLDTFTVDRHGFDGNEILNGQQTLFSKLQEKREDQRNKVIPFPLLDACDYTFEAEYSGNKLSGIFKINDAKIQHTINVQIEDGVNSGDGLVQFNIFDRDIDSVRNTFVKSGVVSSEDRKQISLRDARRALDELSGIAIYRNKFRIRPYGDKNADWLGLDKRRVNNPSKHLEQAQISGLVLVDIEENSGLIERSSREGFEHNDNYKFLQKLLLKALGEIESLRLAHNSRTGKNRRNPENERESSFSKLRETASVKEIERFSEDFSEEKQQEFKTVLNKYKTNLDKLIDIIQERQKILETRSTLGFILAEVLHEAKHPTSAVGSNIISLTKRVKNKWKEGISTEVSEVLLENFEQNVEHIERLETLLKRLDPLINVRRKKSYDFDIYETIRRSLFIYTERAKRKNISIFHEKPNSDLRMNGLEVDLSTAIINIIDNSLYWHETRETKKPFIKINYKTNDDSILIFIEDNAGGISEKYQDAIFNVGFTTKEEGAGLGLSITKESLGRAGSYIHHENTPDGSLFTIDVRKEL